VTYFVNSYSGMLQVFIYLMMVITFSFALIKSYQAFRALAFHRPDDINKRIGSNDFHGSIKTPLSVVAAGFFKKTKKHYDDEKERGEVTDKIIPPDAFIRDAAFQFSERYFEEKFLEPVSMTANLMPPQGFIGTIIGMVIHFLSNTGTLNSELTIAGIATALYTTLFALSCFTFLEFVKKIFYSLAQKRIDEGLIAVSESMINHPPSNSREKNED
ncbi:MAG: MotA/TolQ/ExbB proton channel family protein, partial [Deltaproteobacteria bacterium]|nr:MotA/TolQ/ExbB proton channel family protein [Deltaproteobacteria bacterium]